MNKGRLVLLWVMAAWLVFAIVYPSYHPGTQAAERAKMTFDQLRAVSAAGLDNDPYWRLEPKASALLAIPAILLAIPLWLTLKGKSK